MIKFLESQRSAALTFAFRLAGNRDDAEDMVQDAYLRILRANPDLASEPVARNYLFKAIRNIHIENYRVSMRRVEAVEFSTYLEDEPADSALTPEESLMQKVVCELVVDQVNQLSELDRVSLLSSAGLMPDVQREAISTTTQRTRLCRARAELRSRIYNSRTWRKTLGVAC